MTPANLYRVSWPRSRAQASAAILHVSQEGRCRPDRDAAPEEIAIVCLDPHMHRERHSHGWPVVWVLGYAIASFSFEPAILGYRNDCYAPREQGQRSIVDAVAV